MIHVLNLEKGAASNFQLHVQGTVQHHLNC